MPDYTSKPNWKDPKHRQCMKCGEWFTPWSPAMEGSSMGQQVQHVPVVYDCMTCRSKSEVAV